MSQYLPNGTRRLLDDLQRAVSEQDYVRARALQGGLIAATAQSPSAGALQLMQRELQKIRADLALQQTSRMTQLKELGQKSQRVHAYRQANEPH